MKTSSARYYNYVCPLCLDDIKHDNASRGWSCHKNNPNCPFERGKKD